MTKKITLEPAEWWEFRAKLEMHARRLDQAEIAAQTVLSARAEYESLLSRFADKYDFPKDVGDFKIFPDGFVLALELPDPPQQTDKA